jgi:hypothetical protein
MTLLRLPILSVKFYEAFPALKKLPRTDLAGTRLNYKYMFYSLRACGTLVLLVGVILLGVEMLHGR